MPVNTLRDLTELIEQVEYDAGVLASIVNDASNTTNSDYQGPLPGTVNTRTGFTVRNVQRVLADIENSFVTPEIQGDGLTIIESASIINFVGDALFVYDDNGVATIEISNDLVNRTGFPGDNQLAIWNSFGRIEGDNRLKWNGNVLQVESPDALGGYGAIQSSTVAGGLNFTSYSGDPTTDTFVDFNSPEITTADFYVRLFRETVSTGNVELQIFEGDGTATTQHRLMRDFAYLSEQGGQVVISGSTAPTVSLEVQATDAILLPSGTTAQRPTGVAGYIRYNSDTEAFEGYTDANWIHIGERDPDIINVTVSRDLELTDKRNIIEIDTTLGAVAITIPPDSVLDFPTGSIINITLVNISNAATIVADTGVTLNGVVTGTGTIDATLFSGVLLYKRGPDEWVAQGDIGAVA
jgi:hypothetical protein